MMICVCGVIRSFFLSKQDEEINQMSQTIELLKSQNLEQDETLAQRRIDNETIQEEVARLQVGKYCIWSWSG